MKGFKPLFVIITAIIIMAVAVFVVIKITQ